MSDYANDWVGQILSDGRYRVDAKLGEGGMGFVYKVWDRNLDTDVVVKAPRKSMLDDPEFARRFALEIRSLVKLSHPNIVKVSDVGEHEGLPFAVMQYLSGGTLDERQEYGRDGRPLPAQPASLAGWLPGMAAALDFIHGKGYIHRDVKPGNILFDTHGHAYLSDFGVAKVLSDVESTKKAPSGMTGIGIVLGTPEYMAPELIMGNTFDGRVDQYALAATAYEILCGRKPFEGDTATAILVRQTTQAPPPMTELPPNAAEAISRVMLRGLAKKPGDRFKTCADFATAMVAVLAKAGVASRPVDRMDCPSCGVGFAIPEGLDNYKGKKSRCRACGVPFRIAMDGLSLIKINPEDAPTPSGSMEMPFSDNQPSAAASAAARANRTTMKLDALPATPPGEPAATPARANRTVKMEAMPNPPQGQPAGAAPARPNRTMKMEAMPGGTEYEVNPSRPKRTMKVEVIPSATMMPDGSRPPELDEADPRSPWPWLVAGGGIAAALILGLVLALRPAEKPPSLAEGSLALAPKAGGNLTPARPTVPKLPPNPPEPKKAGSDPANKPESKAPEVAQAGSQGPGSVQTSDGFFPNGQGGGSPGNVGPGAPGIGTVGNGAAGSGQGMAGIQGKDTGDSPEKNDPDVPPDDVPPVNRGFAKSGAPKGPMTFRQIVGEPKDLVNEVVSPSNIVLVNTDTVGQPWAQDRILKVRSPDGTVESFSKPESPFQIVVTPELARQIRSRINEHTLVDGEYPAILKMKIVKDNNGPGYRGVVEWLELLHYIDPKPISGKLHLYESAYCVVHFDPSRSVIGHSPDFKLWQKRIQLMTTSVRNEYTNNNRPAEYDLYARQAMNPAGHAAFFHRWIMKHLR